VSKLELKVCVGSSSPAVVEEFGGGGGWVCGEAGRCGAAASTVGGGRVMSERKGVKCERGEVRRRRNSHTEKKSNWEGSLTEKNFGEKVGS
jgi:hypothetical protein